MFVKFKAGYSIADGSSTDTGRTIKEKIIYIDPKQVVAVKSCAIYLKDSLGEEYETHGVEINLAGGHDHDVEHSIEEVMDMLRLPINARGVA